MKILNHQHSLIRGVTSCFQGIKIISVYTYLIRSKRTDAEKDRLQQKHAICMTVATAPLSYPTVFIRVGLLALYAKNTLKQ